MNRSVHKDTCRIWDRGVCNCGPINAAPESRDAGGAASGEGDAIAKAIDALEAAQNGLAWYRGECPDAVDGSDDEMDAQIGAALFGLRSLSSSIQRAPTPPTDKELLDLAEDCNFSVWNRELYLKVVRAALGWRPKTAALSAAPPSPHPDHTGSEAVAPEAKPTLQDYQDSVMAMFAAVGYTEEYARQWPKEKVSVTFKRWFDEQISRAAAPPAPPAPLPGKPLTKDQIAALLPLIKAEVDTLSDEGRYTFAGWLPIAVRLIEKHHGIAALSAQAAPEYRTGFDEAPSTFNQEDAAPADYPPLPTNADLGFLADDIREEPVTWSLICDLVRKAIAADRTQRSGVSADPLPDLDVDLPDRVIDQLMHDAGVSLMEPWSEQEMYDFANTVKREVLARVPLKMLAASPQHQVKKGEPS